MVMGHVQSGKTTNYSALICKAADAGYKVIILLAGITNSLRSQTQERLDETFIGKKSVFQATAQTALPPSLYIAIRVFVLALAIRTLRGQGKKHCSMMINVSRFNDVQERVLGLVYEYLHKLRNSIIVNGAVSPAKSGDPEIMELRNDFEHEFKSTEFKFSDVLRAASDAAATISVVTINMKGGKLDYQQHAQDGLHVIAIGGLALSRGLTLEGLTVSYILRNTAASDTLMQMARWFGYRPGYEDLCRVYLPEPSLNHYAYIHEAIEELRAEVRRMQAIGLTPQHFGLKVRQSPTAIRITAANKMRSASSLTLAQDYSSRHVEGYSLVNDDAVNRRNVELVQSFIQKLETERFPRSSALSPIPHSSERSSCACADPLLRTAPSGG